MSGCEVCGKGLHDGVALYRQNALGDIPAVWRCGGCNTAPIDPEVRDITEAIQGAPATPPMLVLAHDPDHNITGVSYDGIMLQQHEAPATPEPVDNGGVRYPFCHKGDGWAADFLLGVTPLCAKCGQPEGDSHEFGFRDHAFVEPAPAPAVERPDPRSEKLLRDTVSMLCQVIWNGGRTQPGQHLWSIPVDKTRDFDCILSDAIDELVALRALRQPSQTPETPRTCATCRKWTRDHRYGFGTGTCGVGIQEEDGGTWESFGCNLHEPSPPSQENPT